MRAHENEAVDGDAAPSGGDGHATVTWWRRHIPRNRRHRRPTPHLEPPSPTSPAVVCIATVTGRWYAREALAPAAVPSMLVAAVSYGGGGKEPRRHPRRVSRHHHHSGSSGGRCRGALVASQIFNWCCRRGGGGGPAGRAPRPSPASAGHFQLHAWSRRSSSSPAVAAPKVPTSPSTCATGAQRNEYVARHEARIVPPPPLQSTRAALSIKQPSTAVSSVSTGMAAPACGTASAAATAAGEPPTRGCARAPPPGRRRQGATHKRL